MGRRTATRRKDYIERVRIAAEALPAWACKPVVTDEGLICSVCEYTAIRLSAFFPKDCRLTSCGALEAALAEAGPLTQTARAARVQDAIASATSQMREHGRQRVRERRALLAAMRRGRLQC